MNTLALSDEILLTIDKPARYIGNELNMVKKNPKDVDIRFAMCFPDVYEIGMSHLGIQILYDMFNKRDDVYCERVYSPWPDLHKIMKEKNDKEERLLNVGFKLFTEKGFKDTSIQDIVDNADVAKGTFYLYFKDKYELRDVLIARKSMSLFSEAINAVKSTYIENFADQMIFVINYIIDKLAKTPLLLKFISKNLSWGVYSQTVLNLYEKNKNSEEGLVYLFLNGVKEHNIKLKNPEVTLYMIIELVSSTCFNSILYNEPLPIEEFKPYLYELIRNLLKE